MADINKFRFGLLKSGEEGAELAQAVLKMLNYIDEFEMEDGNVFFEKLVEEFGDSMASQMFTLRHAPEHFIKRVEARALEKIEKYKGKTFDG